MQTLKEFDFNLLKITYIHAQSLQSCPTLYDPMDCSPPGSSVHGILQARILEWVAVPSFRKNPVQRTSVFFCICHFVCFLWMCGKADEFLTHILRRSRRGNFKIYHSNYLLNT